MEAWREELYLSHHGIDGQKWGKKNGPPYPLGYNDHSSAEKKKNPKSLLNKYSQRKEKIKSMSDDDLRKAINRKQLENRYVSLKNDKRNKTIDAAQKAAFAVGNTTKAINNAKKLAGSKGDTTFKYVSDVANASGSLIGLTKNFKGKVNLSEMSDADLKKAVDRMSLEKTYNELTYGPGTIDFINKALNVYNPVMNTVSSSLDLANKLSNNNNNSNTNNNSENLPYAKGNVVGGKKGEQMAKDIKQKMKENAKYFN